MKNLISMKQLTREDIFTILDCAMECKKQPNSNALKGKVLANCFFEPSTRTLLSFEVAAKRMGGEVIGFSDPKITSQQKGESLADAIRIVGQYADVVVIRHPLEGSAKQAAESTNKPVINAGDGANEHPTQTLLDLFSILECQGTLEGLHVIVCGDLLYGRTAHSLLLGLIPFHPRFYFVSPPSLTLPNYLLNELKNASIPFSFHDTIDEVIDRADIVYATRVQKERFSHKIEHSLQISLETLKKAKPTMRILHPLPRVDEIKTEVDATKHAYYFEQAENGVYVRQAILKLLLEEK
ncbi:MAG: aspartate carbamoyltransferase [Chlamydiales bacterium]